MENALDFQKPLWCTEECSQKDYYYLGELPYLTSVESLIYEVNLKVQKLNILCVWSFMRS